MLIQLIQKWSTLHISSWHFVGAASQCLASSICPPLSFSKINHPAAVLVKLESIPLTEWV